MSWQYDNYLQNHKDGVMKGYEWIRENLPNLLIGECDYEWQLLNHDSSKSKIDEYQPYDNYFYGNNKSNAVLEEFNKAWLLHIHRNPHHWQHWVLINDNPDEGEIVLDMPYKYIIEMILDWWSFSWNNNKLDEIFNWYDQHKDYMKLSDNTRKTVVDILEQIKSKLQE